MGDPPRRLVVRLPGQHVVAPGSALCLRLDAKQIHLFDADGRALST
jgi:hypothetical protein